MRKTVQSMVDEAMAVITTYSVDDARDLHGRDDVVFVEELPHTATGKLQKLKLREQFKGYKLPTY